MTPEDFNFPKGTIAKEPRERGNCRLMVVDRTDGTISHHSINALPILLRDNSVWVNNSYAKNGRMNVYSRIEGSHVLPSAGYYLTQDIVNQLDCHTLSLHIGSPSEQENILNGYKSNVGWKEYYALPTYPTGEVAAIGTTVVKALETFARKQKYQGFSTLFIQPPFEFRVVKKFLTNFHFPKECLLALTCAFGGVDLIREAYEVAVQNNYLFGDWGDRLLVI